MPDPVKVQMNFHAPVNSIVVNTQGDLHVNAPAKEIQQLLTDAIAARDKITNKDCWDDVNRLIASKNFEDAIEMARLYEEQNQLRIRGKSLGSFEESGN